MYLDDKAHQGSHLRAIIGQKTWLIDLAHEEDWNLKQKQKKRMLSKEGL